ncbi:endonuclease/exonuclease/phosphatase family protein [Myxococcota bacterium]|nr:endonuclease/exonuclease/phosphatase family protein [Myxococcota bacterium]
MHTLLILLLACAPDAPTPAPTEGSFTALTYNVHGLPPEITGDDTAGRMALIAPLLNDFDVVGLQEDFDDDNHATLVGQATHEWRHRFDEVLPDRVYGPGLAALSRFELIEGGGEHYTACYGVFEGASDCLASKGFELLRLRIGDGELDVYNTHMEAGSNEEDNEARAAQVEQLIEAFERLSAGRAILFMGDTNLADDDAPDLPLITRLIEGGGLTETCVALDCAEPGRIDRILWRDGGGLTLTPTAWEVEPAFWDDEGVPLSDHDAISATFDWRFDG